MAFFSSAMARLGSDNEMDEMDAGDGKGEYDENAKKEASNGHNEEKSQDWKKAGFARKQRLLLRTRLGNACVCDGGGRQVLAVATRYLCPAQACLFTCGGDRNSRPQNLFILTLGSSGGEGKCTQIVKFLLIKPKYSQNTAKKDISLALCWQPSGPQPSMATIRGSQDSGREYAYLRKMGAVFPRRASEKDRQSGSPRKGTYGYSQLHIESVGEFVFAFGSASGIPLAMAQGQEDY